MTNTMLAAGKLPASLLAELLAALPVNDPRLLVGPSVGEDAAVIDFAAGSERLLVAKADPITFATDEIGYYAVNVCANDIAVMGGTPRFYLPTLLLPASHTDRSVAGHIFAQIGAACRRLGIVVAGGHTEVTPAVNQPVVVGAMLGEAPRQRVVRSSGCRPGDIVLLAGGVPVEAASIIARQCHSDLQSRGWGEPELAEAANYLFAPGISVLAPAQAAAAAGLVTAMHDPTEGGVITGLWEMASAAQVGLEIDLDAIAVPELARRLCAEYGLDPLGTISSGALLACAAPDNLDALQSVWRTCGWTGVVIGHVTLQQQGLIARRHGRVIPFPFFAADELTKLGSK